MTGLTPELLAAAGRALTGSEDEWRRPLAVMLAPFHPDRPGATVDPRRMSRWASGQKEIDAWVGPALLILMGASVARAERTYERLRDTERALLAAVPE